jgi:hypothetical protein
LFREDFFDFVDSLTILEIFISFSYCISCLSQSFVASIGIKAQVLSMAPPIRGRGQCFVGLEDVYNHEEMVCEEQVEAYQAHLKAQFASSRDQIEALTKQLSNRGGQRGRRHTPSPHVSEEEDEQSVEDGFGNPFVKRGVHGHQPLVQAHAN